MATAMLMNWRGVTQEDYDRIMERLHLDEDPPAGGLFHLAGPTPDGWRVLDVWESQDAFERFANERLMPTVKGLGTAGEPEIEFFPVYNAWSFASEELKRMSASAMPSGALRA